ncbi:MAG: AI-2E family transporter [Anaerolineales bacterium]|nr:AI-2E family transporter [Anaerolineales bacterium]
MTKENKFTSPPWSQGTRLVVGVLLLIFIAVLIYSTRQLAAPVILGLFLAYILHPLVSYLVRVTRMPRWLAVILLYLVVFILLSGATTGLGFGIFQQIIDVVSDLSELIDEIPAWLEEIQTQAIVIGPWVIDLSQVNLVPIIEQLTSSIQPLVVGTGTLLASIAGTAATTIGNLILIFVIGFYLLMDFNKLMGTFLDLVPETYQNDVRTLMDETGLVWQAFLRGQLILGVIIGISVAIILTILGVEFALGLGLIAGLLEFVPIFGPIISGLIATFVALLQGGSWLGLPPLLFAALIAGIFIIIQQIENNILVPRIIGLSLNLHPLIVLLAALAGGILAGVLGILLAAPTVATLRIWLGYIYRKAVILETEPEPVLGPAPETRTPAVLKRFRGWLRERGIRSKLDT